MNSKKNIIFIVLSGALVYINSLKNSFVWDDISIIINNDFIKGYRLVKEIFLNSLYYFSDINYPYYRPIQTLSYVFDYFLWGLNPFGFHLMNVLLHICVAILIYFLINILFNNPKMSLVNGEQYNGLLNSYKNFAKYKIYRALDIVYFYNGMYSETIFNLKKAKEINPYDININNALAIYYSELGEYNKAIEFFKIALALNPFDKSVYKNFAILYNRLNRVKEAGKLIKKSESIDIF